MSSPPTEAPSDPTPPAPDPPTMSFSAALRALPALPTLIKRSYNHALQTGALTFTPSASTATVPLTPSLSFHLRFCPSLADKPRNTRHATTNPFLPPTPALLVTTLPGYNIVLNRYPVIPLHFLLCTSTFEPQSAPLRPVDLAAAMDVLHAWSDPSRLFAFFNSGPASGASQPHRHLQFIPVDPARSLPFDSSPDGEPWVHPQLPFVSFCVRLETRDLAEAYGTLMELVRAQGVGDGAYNLGMTKEWMVAVPRSSEDGGREGAAINGTVCAGEVLVRTDADWGFFRGGGLGGVLKGIGVENREAGWV